MKEGIKMANIEDYIKWRGDLTLEQSEFNEIDNLILSRFSYLPFDTLMTEDETVTIKELNERFQKEDISKMTILWKNDIDLFPLLGESKRFGNMKATKYINKLDKQEERQFSAITVLMPDDTIYVSYRGTDFTIVGWKEDFNMSFKSHVASQIEAVKYLRNIANIYPNKLRIGGHSKGGNLAIYASTYIDDEFKNRIINIYNNDGPGFEEKITKTFEYKKIIEKVHTYIPQSAIIGRLLNHEEKYTIVKSEERGIMQHDLYSWQVLGTKFVYLEDLTKESKFAEKTVRQWLSDVEPEKRQQVINIIFEIIYKTDAQTFTELRDNWFVNTRTILKTYKNLDNETKHIITQTLNELFKIVKNNIFN